MVLAAAGACKLWPTPAETSPCMTLTAIYCDESEIFWLQIQCFHRTKAPCSKMKCVNAFNAISNGKLLKIQDGRMKHLRLTLTPSEPGEGCDLPCSCTIDVVLGLPLIP